MIWGILVGVFGDFITGGDKHFSILPDFRVDRTKKHNLIGILFIGVCTMICGGEGFTDMEDFAIAKEDWLRKYLELPGGIPSHDTFGRVFSIMDPDAIVAFNPGVLTPVICHTEHEDYTAGEISKALPECPGPWVERDGHRTRFHVLSYLGESWGRGSPRFPDELVVGYTKHVISKGGVVTWDAPISKAGLIPEPFVQQLTSLSGNVGS